MADTREDVPDNVQALIDEQATGDAPVSRKKDDYVPIYRMVGDDKIPVSKHFGLMMKGRRDNALQLRKSRGIDDAWNEAIKYYRHDQLGHRDTAKSPNTAGNRRIARRPNEEFSETENVIFASVNAILPAIYSKNPTVSLTTHIERLRDQCKRIETLLNVLIGRKFAPGLNLKPKAKKGVVLGMLTNAAYLRVDWVFKKNSLEETQAALSNIEQEYANATGQDEIREAEGKLMALADVVDALEPEGPRIRLLSGMQVVVDPDSVLPDMSDANWVMYCDFLPCHYVYAMYCTERDDEFKSIYKPTHILGGKDKDPDLMVENFKLLNDNGSAQAAGFDSDEAYRKSQYMKVWYVWDRATRRVYMYHDDDWKYPIWVWNDPYKLDTFFNLTRLSFHDDPLEGLAKGEITYVLDQQDAVNEINDELNRARKWARRCIYYNSAKLTREQASELVTKGNNQELVGVDVPEGMKLQDMIWAMVPPSMQFVDLFKKEDKYQAIDRIIGTNDVLRGAQFKTNTTNKAIENYNATTALRVDSKIDCIEDWLSDTLWMVAQMCMQFMDPQVVTQLTGEEGEWSFTPEDIRSVYVFRITAGSTQKPTSAVKKQEALQLGQVLGQFVQTNPQLTLTILLKVWERAFDEVIIDTDDWRAIRQSIAGAAGGAPGTDGTTMGPEQLVEAAAMFDKLPPQVKIAIAQAMAKGAPLVDVVQAIVQRMQGGGDGNAPANGAPPPRQTAIPQNRPGKSPGPKTQPM